MLSEAMMAGANTGQASSAASLPSRASRRHVNNWLGDKPFRRAVADVIRGPLKLSATIRCFSSSVQRRRAPVVITSRRDTFGIGV